MLPGAGIYDAFNSIEVIMSGGGGFWDVMNIVSMAVPGAKLVGSLDSLRALSKASKFKRMHCNCFVEGTPVETAEGPRAIESIQEGDIVLTRDQGDPCQPPKAGRVTGIFRSIAPAILWLSFSSGQVIGTTIGHEVWTEQDGWTSAGLLEIGDTLLDQNGNAITVTDTHLDPTPAIVYNLEVEGAHTFFVDGVWVHNNSCRVIRGAFDLFNVRKVPDSDLVRQPSARGNAPVGRDGRAIEIHHVDQSPDGPFEEITWTGHRAIPTRRPGLSREERQWFEAARRRYWEMQWDTGRFNHLPR